MPKNTIVKSRRIIRSGPAAMRKPKGFQAGLALGLINIILVVSPSFAAPITYTEEATASGSLGGVAFTNADVVLNLAGDTTSVHREPDPSVSSGEINSGALTVSVAGAMPATFTWGGGVFHDPGAGAIPGDVGFRSLDANIIVISSVSVNGYDLRTSIGPLSGPAQIFPANNPFPTTGGDFILTSVSSS